MRALGGVLERLEAFLSDHGIRFTRKFLISPCSLLVFGCGVLVGFGDFASDVYKTSAAVWIFKSPAISARRLKYYTLE